MTTPVNETETTYHRPHDHAKTGKYARILAKLEGPCRILEVGCHSGYFTRVLLEAGHTVLGIDKNSVAITFGQREGLPVVCADIEDRSQLQETIEGTFDVILVMDVLEHLAHPKEVIETLLEFLKPEGRIFATGPNVAYWAVRAKLLFGQFQYQDAGILDKTHLRFYTKNSWTQLFRETKLEVLNVSSADSMIPFEHWWIRLPVLCSAIRPAKQLLEKLFPNVFSISFLIEAR